MAAKVTGVKTSQSEIVEAVAGAAELPNSTVQEVIGEYFDEVTRQLKMGNNVSTSIGTFLRADREAGTARNPQTGAQIKTSAKSGARFKVGDRLKKALNS